MRLNKNLCQVNKHFNINSQNNKKSRPYIRNLKAFSFCDFNIKQSSVIQLGERARASCYYMLPYDVDGGGRGGKCTDF